MTSIKATSLRSVDSSADEIEKLYDAFYTQRLADECRFLASDIRALNDVDTLDAKTMKSHLLRRLRIARRLLAKRQLSLF
jgi:uncharacterized protein YerC